jgi:hypothetical protein
MSKRHDVSVNLEEGTTPENPRGFAATIWGDLINGKTGREVWNGVKSDVALMSRGQNVTDCSKVSMNALQMAWAGSDVYDA